MRTLLAASVALVATAASGAQAPFDRAISDLSSPNANVRFRAAEMLKETAYSEAAEPLAKAIADPQDEVQLEAIAAELNIFLADPVVPRKRVGMVIEVRKAVAAEPLFSSGPLAIGPRPVPDAVLTALRAAARDDNPRVGLEALYAFGIVAVEPGGARRRALLQVAGPDLAGFLGSPDPVMRYAAVRVLGRVFAWRPQDAPIDATVGDALISVLNDRDRAVRMAAMDALGALRDDRALQGLGELFAYYAKGEFAEAALDAIARIAQPASTPLLVSALTAKSLAMRISAIEGLARLRDYAALPAIQGAAARDQTDAATIALAFATTALANGPLDPVVEGLAHPKVHEQAKRYLAELAVGRPTAFSRFLQDPDARIRADVVDAIGLGGDPAALPAIEPLAHDRDPLVVRAADRAIARLRQVAVKPIS